MDNLQLQELSRLHPDDQSRVGQRVQNMVRRHTASRIVVPPNQRRIQIPPELYYPYLLRNHYDRDATIQDIHQVLSDHLEGLLSEDYYQRWHSSRLQGLQGLGYGLSQTPPEPEKPKRELPNDWLI